MSKKWCWKSILGYSVVLLITGFAISVLLTRTLDISGNYALSPKSPYDPFFMLGSLFLIVIAPIAAVVLNWRLKEFLVSSTIATSLLTVNLGYGFGFTLLSAVFYLAVTKVAQVIEYYFPRKSE